jgi:hypothetical protein
LDVSEKIKTAYEGDPETQKLVLGIELAQYKRTAILSLYQSLVEEVLRSGCIDDKTAITPQMHVLIWPNEDRGR